MVITCETELPTLEQLETKEVNLSLVTLMAAAPYLGKACEEANNEFMLCRTELNDPRACILLGKNVTACTMKFFRSVKEKCLQEFNQYANCLHKSSGNFEPWHCRKTFEVFAKCMRNKMNMDAPHFGYFTRGRIHKTDCPLPEKRCPPPDPDVDKPRELPADYPRREPRFGSRLYWITE